MMYVTFPEIFQEIDDSNYISQRCVYLKKMPMSWVQSSMHQNKVNLELIFPIKLAF